MQKKTFHMLALLMTLSIFLSVPVKTGKASEKKQLTNNDVIKMVKAELSDAIVLLTIRNSETNFDLSADGLINLKNKGVKSSIVKAMLDADRPPRMAPAQVQQNARQSQHIVQNANKPIHQQPLVQNAAPRGNTSSQTQSSQAIPSGSLFVKIKNGMGEMQVKDLIGLPSDIHTGTTGKSWIPFYYGSDRTRTIYYYKGEGRIFFSGNGRVMKIVYDSSEDGYL